MKPETKKLLKEIISASPEASGDVSAKTQQLLQGMEPSEKDAVIQELLADVRRKQKDINAIKDSPYLPDSIESLSFTGKVNREKVIENEYQKRIDEKHGTAHIFKETASDLAQIIHLDPDTIRLAATEALQNLFEHGSGRVAEIELKIDNINKENAYMEMSFKHHIPHNKFYSLKEANEKADAALLNFDNDRGRGEFMMRELMDERRFINGSEVNEKNQRTYYFKRILRKFTNIENKPKSEKILPEFRNFVDQLENYQVTVFLRIDYTTGKKSFVISSNEKDFDKISRLMEEKEYPFIRKSNYKSYIFSFWTVPEEISQKSMNDIIKEIESISTR